MPAEFSTLLIFPFGRYRHGCDPPIPQTPSSSLPFASKFHHSPFVGLSDFLAFSFISQRLSGIEPFLTSLRHTVVTHQNCLVRPNRSFVAERNT